MKPLKISIITPSLNQGQYLHEAIQSIMAQEYPEYEHIIIDGMSKDNTLDILKEYSMVGNLIWISEKDKGQSDAINKGFRMAKGDIIGWLNADDYYLSGCFSKVLDVFKKFPDVDIIYGDFRFIDKTGKVFKIRKEINFDLFILKYLHILYIPSTAMFFRRKIIEEGNFLREDYQYAMDYEFFLRLALKGYKFMHINSCLADFRWHPQSKSSKAAQKQRMEQEKALLELDVFMQNIPIVIRPVARTFLLFLARIKRTIFKLCNGSLWGDCNL